ncbi:MAG: DUF342 domain-containing protein [Planctomycetes bacterium]|nr:DUF342 domain-containing protein [Planctomycetota bacterium]
MSDQPANSEPIAPPVFVAGATFEGLDLETYAPMKTRALKETRFTIFTPKDKTAAYLVIEGAFAKGCDAEARKLIKEVNINLDAMGEAELSSYLVGKATRGGKKGGVRVALGKPAVNGTDGWIEWHVVEPESFGVGKEKSGGAVDYRERQTFSKVTKGEPILTWHPPTHGEEGRDIFGKAIPPVPGQPNKPRAGVNVSVDGEGAKMSAGIDGVVKLEDDAIHVRLMLEVQDVDFASGNIRFDGDVQVNGEVKEGFEVISQGAVQVLKRVQRATIKARTLFIEGPSGGAKLEVSEHAEVGTLENTELMVGADLKIKGDVVASQVFAGATLIAPEAKIVGGTINALGVMEIGSIESDEAIVESNTKTIRLPQTAEIDAKRAELIAGIEKITAALASSEEPDEKGHRPKLTLQQKTALNALRKKREDLTKALEEADKQKRITLHRMIKDKPRGFIVHNLIVNGARINFDGVLWEAQQEYEGAWSIRYDEDKYKVVVEPYNATTE